MATEEEDELAAGQEEGSLFDSPEIISFRRQLLACTSGLVTGAAAGFISDRLRIRQGVYAKYLQYDQGTREYFPMIGEALGIFLAVPCLYFFGRKVSLVISQLMFLLSLSINEYYSDRLNLPNTAGLEEDYFCLFAQHICMRIYVIVMVVYVTEASQPSWRALFVGLFFTPFLLAIFLGRCFLPAPSCLSAAIITQIFSVAMSMLAPETPYWLALKGEREAAEQMYTYLRAGLGDPSEFEAMVDTAAVDAEERGILNLATPAFCVPLVKVFFMYVATDGVCQVMFTGHQGPVEFLRFNTSYEHTKWHFPEVSLYVHYIVPLVACLFYLPTCLYVSRRILYLTTILASYLIFLVTLIAYVHYNSSSSKTMNLGVLKFCYFISHVGGRPVLLLLPAEIFPGTVKEFGIAACEFLQLIFQATDFLNLDLADKPVPYNFIRLYFVPVGLFLSYLFMPETKDLTLVESQEIGMRFGLPTFSFFPENATEADDVYE